MANLEELQAAVLSIRGVVGAEVAASGSGRPSVRIWTDDSREASELEAEVKALVKRAGDHPNGAMPPTVIREPAAEPAVGAESGPVRPTAAFVDPVAPRRSGLGRGLEALLPDAVDSPPPAHLVSIDLTTPPGLEMIAVEESASGIVVRASDAARNVAEAKVTLGAASVNPTIVAAVAELLGETSAPRLLSLELRDTEAASVLVVTLELADTAIAAGAAVVQGGIPFTLGKAVWSAIRSVRG